MILIIFEKVVPHQDDLKVIEYLTLLQQLNAECYIRSKRLIASTREHKAIDFPLELVSACVSNNRNNMILNCLADISSHALLMKFEIYLVRKLLLSSINLVD